MATINDIAQMSGVQLAIENLRLLSKAYRNKAISFERGRLSDDVHLHFDKPQDHPRFTYVMFNPKKRREIVAASVLIVSSGPGEPLGFQINWAVQPQFRCQGFGLAVAEKAFAEFTSGMTGNIKGGYNIQAVVEDGNEGSLKIARKVVGGEEVLMKDGAPVHSFLKIIQ